MHKRFAQSVSKDFRIFRHIARQFIRNSREAFIGDLAIGALAALLSECLAGSALSQHAIIQILRNFSLWFAESLTKFDYLLFLIQIFVCCLAIALHSSAKEQGWVMTFFLRPFVRFVSDVVALALGATLVIWVFQLVVFDYDLATWPPPSTSEFLQTSADLGLFFLYSAIFWTCRAVVEGYADRYFFESYYGHSVNFQSVFRLVGVMGVGVCAGLIVGLSEKSFLGAVVGFISASFIVMIIMATTDQLAQKRRPLRPDRPNPDTQNGMEIAAQQVTSEHEIP